jgi:hypothetical protein
MTTCKFCKKEDIKLVRSHVPPISFHKEFETHPSEQKAYTQHPDYPPQKSPGGTYDYFACHHCEERFGPWDCYAIELFRKIDPVTKIIDKVKPPEGTTRKCHYIEVREIYDYAKLKLFVLSMLWRFHASNRKEHGLVNLGSKYDKKIREMIQNNDPGGPEDFPIFFRKLMIPKRIRAIISPAKAIVKKMTIYIFTLLDLEIYIKVSHKPYTKKSLDSFDRIISPDEPFTIRLIELEGSQFESELFKKAANPQNSDMNVLTKRITGFNLWTKKFPEE